MRFTHESLPQRAVFATDQAVSAVQFELDQLRAQKVMLIGSERERSLTDAISRQAPVVHRHKEVVMHVPAEVAERAREAAAATGADTLVSVGGGSSIGLAKAVALTTGLPIVAVPTTYAGSEATNVWGMTNGGSKKTGVDDRVLPRSVIYDAALLTTLPSHVAVASGLNALAHCIDSMWGPRADPIDRALAQEGIRGLTAGLPAVAANPRDIAAIEETLYGAYLGAIAFASAGSGIHHKICHVLGGMFNLPHAQTHAVVLPHVLAFNVRNAPDAAARIAAGLGGRSASDALAELYTALEAPRALRDYGMPYDGIAQAAAEIATVVPANNPTPVTVTNISALLRAAWAGIDPA